MIQEPTIGSLWLDTMSTRKYKVTGYSTRMDTRSRSILLTHQGLPDNEYIHIGLEAFTGESDRHGLRRFKQIG